MSPSQTREGHAEVVVDSALRNSQAMYHTLVESLPFALCRKDAESRRVFVNRRYCEFHGVQPQDILGKSDHDLFPPELAARFTEDDQQVLRQGKVLHSIEPHRSQDGREIFVERWKSPVYDAEGAIIGVQVMLWDVTERKRAEDAVREANDFLDSVVENIPIMLFIKEAADLRFVRVNKAGEQLMGIGREALLGKSDYDLFPQEEADFFRRKDREVLAREQVVEISAEEIATADRGIRVLQTKKIPIFDDQGQARYLVGISEDVTEKREVERRLREAKEAAEAASRAKSDFVANMSHEIRTPLNAIIGLTELLLEGGANDTQRDYLRMVQQSGEALLALLNDVLDFSKIEAGKLELDDEIFDLRERLGDAMKSLALRAHGKGLELAFHFHPNVPALLEGDLNRLRQVVVNLVGNAIKFTHHGEVTLDVSCDSVQNGLAQMRFAVRDTGIGIPGEKCQTIFEAFEQVDKSTTRVYGGTGLGLAICRRLVELMGGEIWVESQLHRGSTFFFSAPLRVRAEKPSSIDVEPRAGSLAGLRALIVDDNRTNRIILEEMVRGLGAAPTVASSAIEAMRILREASEAGEPFRVLLSDVNMPLADGYELVESIRRDPDLAHTTALLLTSSERPADELRRQRLKVAVCLMKPVKQSELDHAVRIALGMPLPTAARSEPEAGEAPNLGPLRILLAEDNLVNQRLAVGLLERHGHHVVVASNGSEAARAAAAQAFDVILMDVQMPEMDGFEATQEIRRQEQAGGPRVPIIALTAHALPSDRERCLASGMDDYLAKPIRADELQQKLTAVLARSPAASEARPAPAEQENEPCVNWNEAITNMDGDAELMSVVIEAFLEDTPRVVSALMAAFEKRDPAEFRRKAHMLKGSLRSVAAEPAARITAKLEKLDLPARWDEAATSLPQLEAEVQRVIETLQSPPASCGGKNLQ